MVDEQPSHQLPSTSQYSGTLEQTAQLEHAQWPLVGLGLGLRLVWGS